jgi:hypothetical protein
MAIQYTKSLKNVTQIRNLGLKNCHLAILVQIRRLHVHAYFILQFILAALRMEAYLAYVVPTLCLCCAYVIHCFHMYGPQEQRIVAWVRITAQGKKC